MSYAFKKIFPWLLCAVFVLPLVITPGIMFPWHLGKTVLFQIIIDLICGLIILAGFSYNYKNSNWLDKTIFAFTILLVLSSCWGVNFSQSWWGNQSRADGVLVWVHMVVFYGLLKELFKNDGEIKRVLVLSSVVATLVALTGVFQTHLPLAWQSNVGERLSGIIGNPAFLASYLVVSVGISTVAFLFVKTRWRWLLLGNSIFLAVVTVLTGTRGAWLGLFMGLVVASIVFLKRVFFRGKKVLWLMGGVGAVTAVLVGVASYTGMWKNFITTRSSTVETRLMAWQIAWDGIRERPWGWGMGNYGVVFDKHYNPEFLKHSLAETVWDKPHNGVLEMAVGAGIAGALLYVLIFVVAIYHVLTKDEKQVVGQATEFNHTDALMRAVIVGVTVAYFVQKIFLFDTTNSLIVWYAWLAFISVKYGNSLLSPALLTKQRSWILKLVAIGFLLLVGYKVHYLLLQQSFFTRISDESLRPKFWQGPAQVAIDTNATYGAETSIFLAQKLVYFYNHGFINRAEDIQPVAEKIALSLHAYGVKYPHDLTFALWEGQIYLVLGDKVDKAYFSVAEQAMMRAISIAPRKQEVRFVLGRIYLAQQKWQEAILAHQAAVAIDTNVPLSHWYLALSFASAEKNKQATDEIEQAILLGQKLSLDQQLYLVDLYATQKNYPKILQIYENLKNQDPQNSTWYVKLAATYAAAGDKKQALAMIAEVLKIDPTAQKEAQAFINKNHLQ